MPRHIWLRSETKPNEKRTPLTPYGARQLIERGFQLTVEKSAQSIFPWEQYEAIGCQIAEEFAWMEDAPLDAIVLGLKELEPDDSSLRHQHIHFAHVKKPEWLGAFFKTV